MTRPAKRFLIIFAAVYLVVAVGLNVTLGPPGFTAAFRAEYKNDYNQYLRIVKSDGYKLWRENPVLHPPDVQLSREIAFAQEFERNPAFVREQQRRELYTLLFDAFNALMVVALAYRFGRQPFLNFIDGRIGEIKSRIERAEKSHEAAEKRRMAVERNLEKLQDERDRLREEIEALAAREVEQIREASAQSLALLERETEDRKQYAAILARRGLMEDLVDEALILVIQRYTSRERVLEDDPLIDEFIADLEHMQ